jgi:hypothetical protein
VTLPISLSATALDMLAKCGQQYFYVFPEGMRNVMGVATAAGTAVHNSVASNLQSKLVTGEFLPLGAVQEIADASVRREFDRGVRINAEDGDSEAEALGVTADRVVKMASAHAGEIAPKLHPLAVERGWQLEIPSESITLTGIIDVDEEDGLRDLKTSARKSRSDLADVSDQLTLYGLAKNVIDGVAEPKVTLDYIVAPRGKEAVVQPPLISTRGQEDFDRVLRRIERAAATIRAGAFMPARPTDWWCSERWCSFTSICPFFKRPVSVATKGVG